MSTAVTTGSTQYPAWGLSWTYDRYGNRTAQSIYSGCVSPMTCPTNSVTIDPNTNRITSAGYSYDANGNLTNDGLNTMVYDAENRVVSSTTNGNTVTYTPDGGGLRVKKVNGSTTTVYIFSGTKVVAEYENGAVPGSPTREYIYSGGAMLAKIEAGATKYYHPDHLSNRVITDSSGTIVAQSAHYPYGENWFETGGANKLKFTSYERDTGVNESGNDYAMFRTSVSRLGRFSSPDPIAGSITNPQSLNRYAYVVNDPVNITDPLGLFCHPLADCSGAHGNEWGFGSGGGTLWFMWQPDLIGRTVEGHLPGTDLDVGNYWVIGHWEFLGFASNDSGGDPQERSSGGGIPLNLPLVTPGRSSPLSLLAPMLPNVPIECDPGFIQAANDAWTRAMRGDDPINEAVFAIGGSVSSPTYRPVTDAITQVIPTGLQTTFGVRPNEWGSGHTHPNALAPNPSPADVGVGRQVLPDHSTPLQTYVISSRGLFVTDPRAPNGYRELRPGLSWQVPCN